MRDYIVRKSINNSKNYNYYYSSNKLNKITDTKLLDEIKKIYIPPAYKDVKILLKKDVLATGIDDAGRKQYIYSDLSKKKREIKKYNQLIKLSYNIVSVKSKINKDLLRKEFDKNKIIALILKIMDLCNFRCGNKVYEKKYGSHGLTTLHKKHITMKGNKMEISFVGKKGVQNTCFIKDQKIQKIIKKMYESTNIKNPYIFSLKDPEDNSKYIHITIKDVNKYLEKYSITSKNLRTWNANIIFLKNFKNEVNGLNSDYFNINITSKTTKFKIKKGLIKEAIRKTSESLHHTPSICKSSYIYKKIINDILEDDKIIKSIYNKNISSEELLRNILK